MWHYMIISRLWLLLFLGIMAMNKLSGYQGVYILGSTWVKFGGIVLKCDFDHLGRYYSVFDDGNIVACLFDEIDADVSR